MKVLPFRVLPFIVLLLFVVESPAQHTAPSAPTRDPTTVALFGKALMAGVGIRGVAVWIGHSATFHSDRQVGQNFQARYFRTLDRHIHTTTMSALSKAAGVIRGFSPLRVGFG